MVQLTQKEGKGVLEQRATEIEPNRCDENPTMRAYLASKFVSGFASRTVSRVYHEVV